MRWLARLGLAVVIGGLLLAGGCQKVLFPKDAPRSPYERYMVQRNRARPATQVNAYGIEEPALRERLKPLDH